jgi:hypothetical protein
MALSIRKCIFKMLANTACAPSLHRSAPLRDAPRGRTARTQQKTPRLSPYGDNVPCGMISPTVKQRLEYIQLES